jgi:hypothetical protein
MIIDWENTHVNLGLNNAKHVILPVMGHAAKTIKNTCLPFILSESTADL